jgi:LmbE family N-acetylglucosaminyl deacetylase
VKTLRLDGVRSVLVVAPHPDDEVIGAFGLMRLLRRRGARVRVVIVTDGAGSHPNSRKWPRTRLVGARASETRAALRGIGIGAGDVRFLALPDGGLGTGGGSVRRVLARALAQARGHDLLVMPARDDDHPDHRVVSSVAADARLRARDGRCGGEAGCDPALSQPVRDDRRRSERVHHIAPRTRRLCPSR